MRLIKKSDNWYNLYDGDVGIGSTSEDLQGYRLSLYNCLEIDFTYDLDELAYDCSVEWHGEKMDSAMEIYKEGFQKALELMSDKKFSKEQMFNVYAYIVKNGIVSGGEINDYIQSLQQTEWNVDIKMQRYLEGYEMVGSQKGVYGSGNRIPIYKSEPKLDENGCIILKRI